MLRGYGLGKETDLSVLAIFDTPAEYALNNALQPRVDFSLSLGRYSSVDVTVNGFGYRTMDNQHIDAATLWSLPTDYSLNIFLCPRIATVVSECGTRTKREGQCLIVFAQVIVDFAREESGGVTGLLRESFALVQRFTVDADALFKRMDDGHDDIHKRNVLRNLSPELGNKLVECLECVLLEYRLGVGE